MSPIVKFGKLILPLSLFPQSTAVILSDCVCPVLKRECVGLKMPYKDCVLQNDALSLGDKETTVTQSLFANQSPLIKGWFLLMLVNLGLFLILMH